MDRMGMDRGVVGGGGVGGGMDRMDRMVDRGGGGGGPMMDRTGGLDRPMMMDRTGGGGGPGGPHARSRSASRGFPSRTAPAGPGYHSLDRDRDGYGTDRDGSFMPIDRPRERSLDRGLGGGMDYGGPPYGGGGGGGYGRRDRSLDRGRDPMLDPDDGLYTGGRGDMGPVHRSTRLSPNPVSLQRDAYIRYLPLHVFL